MHQKRHWLLFTLILALCVVAMGCPNPGGTDSPDAIPASAPVVTTAPGYACVGLATLGVEDASWYNIYYAAGSTVTTATGTKIQRLAQICQVTGLTNGTQYAFIMTAANSLGEGPASAVVVATPQNTLPPAAPVVRVASVDDAGATLEWGNVEGAASYRVYIEAGVFVIPDGFSYYSTPGSPCPIDLTNGVKYAACVTAFGPTGESASSNIVWVEPGYGGFIPGIE